MGDPHGHAAVPAWRVLAHDFVPQLRDVDSSSGDSWRQLSQFKAVQSIQKEIEGEASSLPQLELHFQKYWTMHWIPLYSEELSFTRCVEQKLVWSVLYHTHKRFPSENASRLVIMAAGFNPVRTAPYCISVNFTYWPWAAPSEQTSEPEPPWQPRFIPYLVSSKAQAKPYERTCIFTPRQFSSRQG